MTELITITLENEMDLTLAYKRSILTGAMLGLTVATQTAFATAVSEVCREVIDKALEGIATLGTIADAGKFYLIALISAQVDEQFDHGAEGFEYARKLVPVLNIEQQEKTITISLRLAIPRATHIDQRRILAVKKQIATDGPVSAYEEVKQKNAALAYQNLQKDTALTQAEYLNQQRLEFISVASHELNSPLTVLRSYTQIALKVLGDQSGPLPKYLQKIDVQTTKLVNLIRQLMDVSKLEHGNISYQMENTSLNQFLSEAVEGLRLIVNAHKVELNLTDDSTVLIDKLRLEQVLNNLVGNAAKYSGPGTLIKIDVGFADGRAMISVTDEGIGMSEATQKQVFEKFYRNKQIEKKYNGLGMGLYIASRILIDHHGTINVSSAEGAGSVFSFTLPVVS